MRGYSTSRPLSTQEVGELKRAYAAWHWGEPAKLVKQIDDPLVPNVVGIGRLVCFELDGDQELQFPTGCWLAYDKAHPHERIHVITTPAFRASVRNAMKRVKNPVPLQNIARQTRGTHVRYPLPNLRGVPLGVLEAVVYHTLKRGDAPSVKREGVWGSEYHHEFGKEHSRGIKPILAADVTGRIWVCGGSYTCPLAGITG